MLRSQHRVVGVSDNAEENLITPITARTSTGISCPPVFALVSSSRSYRKHLCALWWGMFTFSRGMLSEPSSENETRQIVGVDRRPAGRGEPLRGVPVR